jgi:ABC-type transport system substrate-binding protein
LLDNARAALEAELRLEFYRQAEERIRADAPCVALVHESDSILLSSRWTGIPLGYLAESLEVERARRVEP